MDAWPRGQPTQLEKAVAYEVILAKSFGLLVNVAAPNSYNTPPFSRYLPPDQLTRAANTKPAGGQICPTGKKGAGRIGFSIFAPTSSALLHAYQATSGVNKQ